MLIGSLRNLRQLVSLTLVHSGHDLAGQQVHGERTQHGDSFEDRSGQVSDGQDGSEGRTDLHDLVPERAGQPDDHGHGKEGAHPHARMRYTLVRLLEEAVSCTVGNSL